MCRCACATRADDAQSSISAGRPTRPGVERVAGPSSVLVVIPALNEEATVASVIGPCGPSCPTRVSSSSTTTRPTTPAVGQPTPVPSWPGMPFTMGVGGAMRTGYSYALRSGYEAVVQVDGDGQHDPRHIPELVAALAHDDIVIGARFAGGDPYAVGAARRFAMSSLARVMSRLLRTRLTDVTSGYRALGPRALRVFAEHYPAEYLGDTVEALVIAKRCGLTVTQLPVRMTAREHGRPSQGVVGSILYLGRAMAAIGLGLVRRWPCPPATEGSTT